ncbi:MAG: tetraacyldisaccharide 4'-kinase [Nitrospirae bacterium]|nr:tetraacyldisaccharide 4'-kinase [Nitrospirota bacterium]
MNVIEYLYYAIHLANMGRRLKRMRYLPQKVVSVGNVTLGGTGKTPAVIALASEALRRGLKVAVLTRGYGGKGKGALLVSTGAGPLVGFEEGGDEPVLMAAKLRGVEVIKGADRYAAAGLSAGTDLFILDDGFQRVDVHRDIDVVLVDSIKGFGNGRLFPLGPLREPVSALSRAHFIVETNSPGSAAPEKKKTYPAPLEGAGSTGVATNPPFVYSAVHKPVALLSRAGTSLPLSTIESVPVTAFCGIGNPMGFKRSLQSLGALVVHLETFPDHHLYRSQDLKRVLKKAGSCKWIITTEKDIIKLGGWPDLENLLALAVEFQVGGDFYDKVFGMAGFCDRRDNII